MEWRLIAKIKDLLSTALSHQERSDKILGILSETKTMVRNLYRQSLLAKKRRKSADIFKTMAYLDCFVLNILQIYCFSAQPSKQNIWRPIKSNKAKLWSTKIKISCDFLAEMI